MPGLEPAARFQNSKEITMGLTERTILNRMNSLGLSRVVLGQLVNLREQYLCAALKCTIPLLNDDINSIHRVLSILEAVVDLARPFDVSMTDVKKLKFLLEKFEDGDLSLVMTPIAKQISAEMEAVR
jgi:hypothetical protein